MERRQLDFNAPLLSARRYSSPSRSSELVKRKVTETCRRQSLPLNKSDWDNEGVTKPAAIPFQWEQIPGRPKGEQESQSHTPDEPSNTPRLPPGRVFDSLRRNSGEAPKLPPGRLSGPSRYNSGERLNDPNIYGSQVDVFSFNDHAKLLEKLNESLNCKDDSDSESGDDAFSDALNTLSPTESCSFNYSVSGISGYHSSGMKPSGTFCVDTQTRDFMLNRFLPAAKAVILETPQYVGKKPSVLNEQPKQIRKAVSGEMKPSVLNEQLKQIKKAVSGEMKPSAKQYSTDILPYYSRYMDNAESEDDDQGYNVPVKKSWKAWGILPRFCVKNSLCLLNPIPGMKSKSRAPTPSAREVRRLTRNAHSGPLNKSACQVPLKKKFHSGLLSRDLPGVEHKLTNDSSQFSNSRDSFKAGLSPLRRYRSGNISPYRNESPRSPFREGVGFLGVPKEVQYHNDNKIASSRKLFKALQDVSRNQINERGSTQTNDAVEKILYIDSVNKTDLPISKSDFYGERSKILAGSRQKEDICAAKSDQSISCPKQSPRAESTDVVFGTKEEQNQVSNCIKESDPTLKSPLPPPLPKSPSESWLWRTLPSIPLGNPFANSRQSSPVNSKKQGHKTSAIDTKWETIVKTSNLRHDHVRYSQELIPHASHRHRKA